MKKLLIVLLSSGVIGALSCNEPGGSGEKKEAKPETNNKEAMIARGKYLVTIMSCNDCHSPKTMTEHGPEPDMSKELSGHPADAPLPKIDPAALKDWVLMGQDITSFVGPWGVSFAANLTSDETGIGSWSENQFIYAIRNGKFKGQAGGRDLLPPMPWQFIRQSTDEDLRAIFAYLKSTRPVANVVPAPIPPAGK